MKNKTCGECRYFDETSDMCDVRFDSFIETYAETKACELFKQGLCVKQNSKNETQSDLCKSDDTESDGEDDTDR